MKLKYIKAQNTKITDEQLANTMVKMVLVSVSGNAYISNISINRIREYLQNHGYEEGSDFIFYGNNLYISQSITSLELKKVLAPIFHNNLPSSVSFYHPSIKKDILEQTKKNKIEVPVWRLVLLPNTIAMKSVLSDLNEYLEGVGYNAGIDFQIHISYLYVNQAIDKYRFSSLIDEISKFMTERGIIQEGKKINTTNAYSPINLYGSVSLVTIQSPLPNEPVWKGMDSVLNLSDIEKSDCSVSDDGRSVKVNRLSGEYDTIMFLLRTHLNQKGISEEIPKPKTESSFKGKRWKKVSFASVDGSEVDINKVAKDLSNRAFNENEDFSMIGNTLFVNIMSSEYMNLEKVLAMFATENRFGISSFIIDYKVGRKESEVVTQHWGQEIPTKYKSVGFINLEYANLFNLTRDTNAITSPVNDTMDERLVRIVYSERCIESLSYKGALNFFARTDGIVNCQIEWTEMVSSVMKAHDSELSSNLIQMKKMKSQDEVSAFVKRKIGSSGLTNTNEKKEDNSNRIKNFWYSSDNPFRSFISPSEDQFKKMNSILDEFESNEGFVFEEQTNNRKADVVRDMMVRLNFFHGYDGSFFGDEDTYQNVGLVKSYPDYFLELAASRKIVVDNKALSMGDELYEYLVVRNGNNCLRVSAFLEEFLFNVESKFSVSSSKLNVPKEKILLRHAIWSFVLSALESIKKHVLFSPVPGDEELTKSKMDKYVQLINSFEIEDYESVLNAVKDMVLKNKIDFTGFKTLLSIRISPLYKEIVKIINTKISDKIASLH